MHGFRSWLAWVALVLGASAAAHGRDLTFEQRVKAQEALERVYYRHQIGSLRPFEEAVPQSVLESRVATYLDESAALQTIWKTPITADMLTRELDRMAAHTRMPQRLSELLSALSDDPFLIRECLARATLVDRLARSFFSADESLHAAKRLEAEALRRDLVRFGVERFVDDARRADVVIARGAVPSVAGEVGPVRSEPGAFVVSVVLEQRPDSTRIARFTLLKRSWDDWWAEARKGLDRAAVAPVADASPQPKLVERSSGSDPKFDEASVASIPCLTGCAAKVWTGSVVVAWGGCGEAGLRTGGRYDPATDTWTPAPAMDAPPENDDLQASWDGDRVIVRSRGDDRVATRGGRYDVVADTWQPLGRPTQGSVADAGKSFAGAEPGGEEPPTTGGGGPIARTPTPQANTNVMMPHVSEAANGLVFPIDTPTPSQIFLGSQGAYFGYCIGGTSAGAACTSDQNCPGGVCELELDNTFCLSYNMSCGGERANPKEYGFNDVLEATYDSSPAPGRQTWIERNWNYISSAGQFWRPFHFALEVDANSTCVGGSNEGAPCRQGEVPSACSGGGTCTGRPPAGAARWTFTPNNRNGNTSLQLHWPWVALNHRAGQDVYWLNGFSTWMRTSDFDPHGTVNGARFTTYADHANDRSGPWLNGVYSVVDFNTTSASGKLGWINAGLFDARISGPTPSREIGALTGVRSEVNLVSTGAPQVVAQSYGVFVQFNPTGSGIAAGNFTGVLVATPAPSGPGTSLGAQFGLQIADQQFARSGAQGSAILVSSQSATGGSQGNLRFEGGSWNNGHLELAQGHLWRDGTAGTLRYKSAAAPASESDGSVLLSGTSADTHGFVLWGVSTSADAGYDSGTEVCAASGLTCVDTTEIANAASIDCRAAHTSRRWIAYCK